MKLLNSKVMSFEEDCVEYENEQEYLEDLDKRRKAGWTQLKTPDFENGVMKRVSKQLPTGILRSDISVLMVLSWIFRRNIII